ncbi:MAG: molybdenum cofactor guanylyltransferase MobA [Hasllibacter sp.]
MKPPVVILAGGASRRMGGGLKGLAPLGGTTLIESALSRLRPQAGEMALNANDPGFEGLGLPILPDPVAGRPGPLAGVLAAMLWARDRGAARVATAAADTPFPPADLIARLTAVGAPIAMAATPDPERGRLRHPVFALWDVALADALEAALAEGTRRVVAFADAQGCRDAEFDDEAAFFNVNTPEDLAAARAMA